MWSPVPTLPVVSSWCVVHGNIAVVVLKKFVTSGAKPNVVAGRFFNTAVLFSWF